MSIVKLKNTYIDPTKIWAMSELIEDEAHQTASGTINGCSISCKYSEDCIEEFRSQYKTILGKFYTHAVNNIS